MRVLEHYGFTENSTGRLKNLPTFLSYLKRYMESWRAQNPILRVRTDCLKKKKSKDEQLDILPNTRYFSK